MSSRKVKFYTVDDMAFIEFADKVFYNYLPDLFRDLLKYCKEWELNPENFKVTEIEKTDERAIMQTLQYVPLECGDE